MPSAMISIFEFETVADLEHRNSVIFSLILKRWVRFGNLFEISTSICNRNFAIFCRLGVTLTSLEDIFEMNKSDRRTKMRPIVERKKQFLYHFHWTDKEIT